MNWFKLSNKNFIILVFLSAITTVSGQDLLQDYQKKYPDFNELIIDNSQYYNFSIEKNKIKIIQDNHKESIILTQNGIQNNQESFTYSDLVKINSYEASTILNANGKDKKIKVTQTNEKNAQENSVFYSDVKQRNLIFPSLEAGAKKEYSYQYEFLDPFLLQKFIFGSDLPINNATFEVQFDKDIAVGYKVFNDPKNTITFSKSEKKGKQVYNWTSKNINAVKFESSSPGFLYQVPHVVVYIKDYKIKDIKTDVLDDVTKLHNYYKGFVKNLNKNEDEDLKKITLDVIENKTTDEEKLKAIFYWVKDNVKYIAFENGYEGFIPREASLVCKRKFGDCKDMASIITEMAKYAAIPKVAITWIGSRRIPYTYEQLPTPAVDDHMIATYTIGDKIIYLDATDKETRYGIPTSFIQGKEALINQNNETFVVKKVPIVAADDNEFKDIVKIKIENEKIIGSGTMQLNGYNRSSILSQIGDATNKTRFELIKSLVLKGNNKFKLKDDFKEENISDRDKPYNIIYNFELENYAVKVDNELYVNLFLDKMYEKMSIEKDRIAQYDFDYLTFTNNTYQLEIPSTHTVKYLPKNFNLDNDLATVDINYEVKGKNVNLNLKIKQKKMLLDTSDFEIWNETIKKLKDNYSETIILAKI